MEAQSKALRICLELKKKYGNDFEGWVRDNINFDGLRLRFLTEQQLDIANALINHRYLAVAGGGGIGKTAVAALLILWFLTTHPFSKVPTTAPSGHLLIDVLWSEISFWLSRCRLKGLFHPTTTRLQVKGHKAWYAVARTVPRESGKPLNDTLAGFHAPYLFVVCDEASGIPDPVFTALDGALTNEDAYILLISNPVSVSGYFYDVVSGSGVGGYAVKHYSSLESELVDEGYERRIIDRYGENSPMHRAKVKGELIKMNEGVVVAPDVFDEVVRENRDMQDGSVVLGVDVGGSDSRSVICHRIGNSIVHWDVLEGIDTDRLVDKILGIWEFRYRKKPITVVVDAIGKGSGVYDRLKNSKKFRVIGHVGSERARDDRAYQNKRAELYDKLKKGFSQLHFPVKPPERLKKQLCNIRFDFAKEKIALEDKRVLIERLGHSPDEADALSLTEAADSYVSDSRPTYVGSARMIVMNRRRCAGSRYGRFSRFL